MAKMRSTINMTIAENAYGKSAERAMSAVMVDATGRTIEELSQPGTGRIYKKSSKVSHQASEAGQAPAPDTGDLRRSIQTEVFRKRGEVSGVLSVNKEYAAALELGTEKIAPRPFLSTVMRENAKRFKDTFRRFL